MPVVPRKILDLLLMKHGMQELSLSVKPMTFFIGGLNQETPLKMTLLYCGLQGALDVLVKLHCSLKMDLINSKTTKKHYNRIPTHGMKKLILFTLTNQLEPDFLKRVFPILTLMKIKLLKIWLNL